jgi:hypothetical protein
VLHTPPATAYLLREQNTAATARADAKGMSQLTCQCRSDAGEATLMKTYSNTTGPAGPKSPWFGIGRFLFIVALAVIFFLLAQSMVSHRFFRGGRVNRNGSLGP